MSKNIPKIFYHSFAPAEVYQLVSEQANGDFEIVFLDADDDAERMEKLADCDGVIVGAKKLTSEHIAAAPKLQLVQHQGVGWHDTTDWRAMKERGIRLAITLAGSTVSVSEHTILLILAAAKHLPYADAQLRQGRWMVNDLRMSSRQLSEMTVGILGMGRIGSLVAQRLSPFGCNILYTDPFVTKDADFTSACRVEKVEFETLIANSDVLTLHLPLMKSTKNIISAEVLAQMKPGSIFINAARGGLVDEIALDKALSDGHLMSAGLDVLETEPALAENPLLKNPKCVLSPHIAAGTKDGMRQKMGGVMDNLRSFFAENTLENEIDLHAHE